MIDQIVIYGVGFLIVLFIMLCVVDLVLSVGQEATWSRRNRKR